MTTVLIIEDDLELRTDLAEILAVEGYDVFTAENGIEGLEIIHSQPPHLILCDIHMSRLDGYGVFKALRENPTLANIPFIFITAQPPGISRQPEILNAADDIIIKPFDVQHLLLKIERFAKV